MIYVDCEQGSDEWFGNRIGIPTASGASNIVTPKTGALSASSTSYMAELIAEMVDPDTKFQGNQWTERGHELEPEARAWYEFQTGRVVRQVGIILLDDRSAGVSPDGLIGEDGMLEIKCPMPKTHVHYLLAGELPSEYKPQCHAALHLAKRKWLDFVSYCPGFRTLLIRIEPNEYTEKVGTALSEFTKRLIEAKASIFEEAA